MNDSPEKMKMLEMFNNPDNWVRFVLTPSSRIFPFFQDAIKKVKTGDNFGILRVLNKERSEKIKKEVWEYYKLSFEWQDKNICGIDVFRNIGGE